MGQPRGKLLKKIDFKLYDCVKHLLISVNFLAKEMGSCHIILKDKLGIVQILTY